MHVLIQHRWQVLLISHLTSHFVVELVFIIIRNIALLSKILSLWIHLILRHLKLIAHCTLGQQLRILVHLLILMLISITISLCSHHTAQPNQRSIHIRRWCSSPLEVSWIGCIVLLLDENVMLMVILLCLCSCLILSLYQFLLFYQLLLLNRYSLIRIWVGLTGFWRV